MERYRRGKAHRARRLGSVNMLPRRPLRIPVRPQEQVRRAAYEITGHEPVLVAEMFRR